MISTLHPNQGRVLSAKVAFDEYTSASQALDILQDSLAQEEYVVDTVKYVRLPTSLALLEPDTSITGERLLRRDTHRDNREELRADASGVGTRATLPRRRHYCPLGPRTSQERQRRRDLHGHRPHVPGLERNRGTFSAVFSAPVMLNANDTHI